MMMKLLLITRKYPPVIGGMEKYSKDLYEELSKNIDVDLVANKKGNKFLLFFLVKVFFILLFRRRKYTNIHFTDGLLSFLIPLAKTSQNKVTITVHGLDVTYINSLYQWMIKRYLSKADEIVSVSSYTKKQCVQRGVSTKKVTVIPNGIRFDELTPVTKTRKEVHQQYELFSQKKILLTVGRLVKRKGHEWFIREVVPELSSEYVYFIVGSGPERENIEKAISDAGVSDRVRLLGRVSGKNLANLYSSSHLFIMPNIKVEGDPEGFGVVLIEAAAYGLPCVASKLEGITDAVIEGKTGWLVSGSFAKIVSSKLPFENVSSSAKIYSWSLIIERYLHFYD